MPGPARWPGSGGCPVASGTGGQVLAAASGSDVTTTLHDVVTTSLAAPYATIGDGYYAAIGKPVTFSAAGSFDPAAGTLSYAWDIDNNGTVDATTTTCGVPKPRHR